MAPTPKLLDAKAAEIVDQLRAITSLYEIESYGPEITVLDAADALLDTVEANTELARGRTMHARFIHGAAANSAALLHFERAADRCARVGDARGEAEARFWLGTFYQTVHADDEAAMPHLNRSRELALRVDDKLILSCVERHLGFVDVRAGRLTDARGHLEASVALRREIGFDVGVAAGLVALAELALDNGDYEQVAELLAEATQLAAQSGATGILRVIERVSGGIGVAGKRRLHQFGVSRRSAVKAPNEPPT